MPNPTDVLPLMDQGDQLLQVGEDGRGFYQQASAPSKFSASLSGDGMGGSLRPASGSIVVSGPRAVAASQRQPSPEELMALAERMQSQYDFTPGPSQVEPTLEADTGVPYWLRNYAEKTGIDKGAGQEGSKPKEEIIASNKYLSDSEKRKYLR